MHRSVAVVALCLLAQLAHGQNSTATFQFQPPLTQVDGTPISEKPITGYRLLWGMTPSSLTNQVLFPGNATEFEVEMLPDVGPAVYAVVYASNVDGEGLRSNVACFTFEGPACLPGPFETDVISVTLTDAGTTPPPSSWSKGFNFRQTANYVTDPIGTTYVAADLYPTTRNGVTFGWEGAGVESRNRTTSLAPQLAGQNQLVSGTPNAERAFRVDLPAPGTYRIRVAAGDATEFNNRAAFDLRDGTTTVYSFPTTTVSAANYANALGNIFPAATILSAPTRDVTFTSSTFRFVLRRPMGASSVIAHLSLERVN